ncbi:MAG: glycosyltransferase [Patescibacteria group bacterium]
MNKIQVSIIIVNYKTKGELFTCVKSIIDSKPKIKHEIIVVDNDRDKTIEDNLRKSFPEIIYVPNENLGYSQGNNLGAKHAKGEYLFFLNPDTRLYRDTLSKLLKFIKNKTDVGAVSPLLIQENGKSHAVVGSQFPTPIRVIFSLSFIHRLFPDNFISSRFFLKDWNRKASLMVDVVPGTAIMIKKSIFEKIGGFDEKYFLFFEEADLAKKIKKLGLNNYIIPEAKIVHFGGISTKQRRDIKEIYRESQFYYFKKWYGLFWALIINSMTSIGKYEITLFFILILALFLRTFRLNETMSFIGDQGWFYLSAKDMLLTGQIPLVGITSSHTWLHQGPYWTYILAFIFKFFSFNPLIPGYFTAVLGSLSIFFIYKLIKEMLGKEVSIISSFLYATSPLAVINDRFPYHTTLIPLFTLFYIYVLYKWIQGEKGYFVWAIILLGILYNFELATFSLGGVLTVFLLFGLFKRKKWAVSFSDKRIILFSFIGLSAVMLPVLIYDFKNGFYQTLVFGGWIFYKIFKSIAGFSSSSFDSGLITSFLASRYKLLTFASNFSVSILFLFSSFVFFSYLLKKEKSAPLFIIAISSVIVLLGFMANKTPSDAYLPIFFPIIIVVSAITWDFLFKKIKLFAFMLLFLFGFMNAYYFLNNNLSADNADIMRREEAVSKIVEFTSGDRYNLIGKGVGSQFDSFTMNYEYLLWYYYKSKPSKNPTNLRIYIEEKNGKIFVSKND